VRGGVFQNAVLVDLIQSHCQSNSICLHLHQELSPNDENISFGQYMHYLHITS
jgi:hydrogenase maturation protein HypF